ncbi:unnamed protein product [Callosobruchus maculatus]|uniref:Odorant receptor n=1 Tax=Callosobruchus maculatus TaxID=64391 RepID=A0A653D3D6_CALMS|nr:unnamed protein product [Callosobruchus maculatus]
MEEQIPSRPQIDTETVVKLTILLQHSGTLKQILLTTLNSYWPNFFEPELDGMLKKLYKQQMYTVVYLLFCALLFSAVFLLSPLVATERTTENVEKVFNLAAAFQLGSSVVAICVSSFIATRDDVDATQIISMSSYLIGHLVQLFIYCNVGNELHFQSSQLSESIYTSRWNEVNCLKLKKDLVFVLMKSQVPAKITAFKVLTLNYETL